jgi:hypothetical protein
LLWRVTLTEFARWWRWRAERRWSLVPRGDLRFEVQLDEWSRSFPLGLEIVRGNHISRVPITGPRMSLRLDDLAYERRASPAEIPSPTPARRPPDWKSAVRTALDWETVTPLAELPASSLTDCVKKGLRWWRHEQRAEVGK